VTIVFTGIFYPSQSTGIRYLDFSRKDYFLAEVCQKPAEKAKTFQTILSIQNEKLTNPQRVVVYFSKNGFDSTITTGDQLIILAKPQRIKNSGNPFEFDYQTMMQLRNIWFSIYLESGTYLKTGHRIVTLNNLSEKTRDRLIAWFPEILPDREERSVVSALTLGYRTDIEQNTLDYFASTGAMHVLSVSGLHVALIYMILGFLLAFLKRGTAGPLIFSSIMISFLWIYAFISGFSPPVQRATVMFTFVIIGENIRRPVNIYNSLTASALFLVLLNPSVLFDVGFQLSYLAIFGIVLIQPALYNIFELTNPMLKWAWSLFTVSVAAQLATFPLGLFYFNQFPNLFWLSNFVVVPVTTLIMWVTLAFFIFIPFHVLATYSGIIIQKLTFFMLVSLKAMDAQPLAVTKGIVLSPWQVWILYGIIIALLVYAFSKKKRWLFYGLSLTLALQYTELAANIKLLNQRHIFVYNSQNTMIHLINGRSNYLVTNNIFLPESDRHTVQKVIDHLKLSSPIIIDRRKNFQSDDLILSHNLLYFLNCVIEFKPKPKYLNTDQLTLSFQNDNSFQKEVENINISTGNVNFRSAKTSVINFSTKAEGAYHFQFK
jgi:competence protein ComEC